MQSLHTNINLDIGIIKHGIKTHSSMSCGPRKWGACKWNEHIDRNNNRAMISHICSSMMSHIPNLNKIPSVVLEI